MFTATDTRHMAQAVRLAARARFWARPNPHVGYVLAKGDEIADESRELTERLDGLYGFVMDRIIRANLDRDLAPLQESIEILRTLEEGWEGAVDDA